MTMSVRLVALLLLAVGTMSVDAQTTECIDKLNACGGDAMVALVKMIEGASLDSYGLGMLETFCRDKDSLMGCFLSSGDVCPEAVVDMMKVKLQAATFSCDAMDCTKKIISCGTDISNKFQIGLSKSPENYLLMSNGPLEDMCRTCLYVVGADDDTVFADLRLYLLMLVYQCMDAMPNLKTCIMSAETECTSIVTNIWIVTLDAMKFTCDMLPCNNALNACFGPANIYMINPTFDVSTLHMICGVLGSMNNCLDRITTCPKSVIDMFSYTMKTYHGLCKTAADCTKSVVDCIGDAANPFLGAVAGGKVTVDTLDKVCPVKDRVSLCLRQSTTCPPSFTSQYEASVASFATLGCNYMDCAKQYETCVGEVGKVLVTGSDYGVGALEQVCASQDIIARCLAQLTPVCPAEYVQMQNAIVQGYLGMGCQFVPCIRKMQDCHLSMLQGVDIQHLNPGSLVIFCSNVVAAKTCMAALGPECPDEVTASYQAPMQMWADSCSTVACTNELAGCFGKHGYNIMNPKFDAVTLTNACSDINNINTCVQQITTCPAEFLKPYVNAANSYQTMCQQIAACGDSLQKCGGDNAGAFLRAGSGDVGVATLQQICRAEDLLTTCIGQLTTCPREVVGTYISTMNFVKMGCAFNACMKSLEACGGAVMEIFVSGTDYATGGLEQICKQNATISSCLAQMGDVCPSSVIQVQQMELAVTLQSCRYVPCAKEVQSCGVEMFSNIQMTSFDQDSLVSFCKSVRNVERCLNGITNEACSKSVSNEWEGPLKTWAAKCGDIVRRVQEKSRPSTVDRPVTGGKKVAIVLKLQMKWDPLLEDLESEANKPFVAELKNSLTEVYKDTKGFKEVIIVRLFQSSVGVEHTVEYDQELSTKDLAVVAATLNAALAKNGDALSVGNRTFAAVGTPEMLFGDKPVELGDLCDLYTKDTECKNGGSCYASTSEARCVCQYGYRGDYCEVKSGQSTTLPTIAALVGSVIGGILLAQMYV